MRQARAVSPLRRARTLAISLTALLLGATFYAHNVRADDSCGAQADFLVKSNPLMTAIQPADCARLYDRAPAFAWPQARGHGFVVAVTYPDGRVAKASTPGNWLSWDDSLPPGEYSWTVTSTDANGATSQSRRFTVDRAASRS